MKTTPDYEIKATIVNFYGKTRCEALKKLVAFFEQNGNDGWNSNAENIVVETSYFEEDGDFIATCISKFHPES